MSIDLEDWKQRIAEISAATELKLYLGDVYSFEEHGVPEFIAHPTREFAILPVVETGASPDRIIKRNREVIETVAGAGLKALQLVVEWESLECESLEPAVVAVSREPGFDLADFERRLAEVRTALGAPPVWLLCDSQGLWKVSERARVALPQDSTLEGLSEGYGRLYEGRAGTCRPVGLSRPQNSLSGLLFSKIGLATGAGYGTPMRSRGMAAR